MDQPKLLREWAPLTELFTKLPTRVQNGIFSHEVKLTCIDILPEFVALATNIGIVYWYDRRSKDLQRLRCENSNAAITCIKILSTVDYMVACGNRLGNISIFQIPKTLPDNIPDSLKPKNKQIERYSVTDLHKSPISALEWSKNGMKLFSGDKSGVVVSTEIDFYMHMSKSLEILNESYEVVQLSYCQNYLLVSTTFRCIICQKSDKWHVCQIGKKDRKILGYFGGLVYQNSYKPSDCQLYCTRPGLRIWVADLDGNVQKTLLFKDLLNRECSEVPIINPISHNLKQLKPQKELCFGRLLTFNDNLLLTYNDDVVYVLQPRDMSVLYTISQLRGILSVATHKDEIFILEEHRSVIRISFTPEDNVASVANTSMSQLPLATLFDIKSNNDANVVVHTDETLVVRADEAKESPVKRNIREFDDIGKQDFEDDILYRKNRSRKRYNAVSSTASVTSDSSEERDASFNKATVMNLSAVGVLPDLRSPESIQNDIEYKEKILADMLNLDKVKISELNPPEKCLKDRKISVSSEDGIVFKNTQPQTKVVKSTNKHDRKSDGVNAVKTSSKTAVTGGVNLNTSSPLLKDIPNDWKLDNIQLGELSVERKLSRGSPDVSLSDWEII